MSIQPTTPARKPAAIASQQASGAENFWWIVLCIVTLGGAYFSKILIKRAMIEAAVAEQYARTSR